MSENTISKKVQQFLVRHIQSVEQLEIFLTLAQERSRFLSAHDIFLQIQSSEKSVSACLDSFLKGGLTTMDQTGRYRLRDDTALAELVSELQRHYRERRVTVIEMIYQRPPGQIQSFADAFRFRKDK